MQILTCSLRCFSLSLSLSNDRWNALAGTRAFWTDTKKGYNTVVSGLRSCPGAYSYASWFSYSTKCIIDSSYKFLGERCDRTEQCSENPFVSKYVDLVCGATSNSASDPQNKCIFAEEKNAVAQSSTCACDKSPGVSWCFSTSCPLDGFCVKSGDGKRHCKWGDVPLEYDKTGSCSNCRKSETACKAYGGMDASKTDTSKQAGVAGGVVGLGAVVGLFGYGLKRKRDRAAAKGEKMQELVIGTNTGRGKVV